MAILAEEKRVQSTPNPGWIESSGLEVQGAAATEVVTLWGDTVLGVTHYPHTGTFGAERHITTRGESAIAGACMVAGGLVFGPALGSLVRRIYDPQVVPKTKEFTVGEDPNCDVWITQESLGGLSRGSLVEADAQGSRINLLTGVAGELILPDGSRQDIHSFAGGRSSLELPAGSRACLRLGEFNFVVRSVLPGRLPAVSAALDWSSMTFTGFSIFVHAMFLALIFLIPPDDTTISTDMLDDDNRFIRYALIPSEIEAPQDPSWINQPQSTQPQGGRGKRHVGDEGAMGDQRAKRTDNRYGVKGPANNPNPQMGRPTEAEVQNSGILAVLQNAPTSPFGVDRPLGNDPENALGAMMGNMIGSNFGYNGLGVRGTGRGGGGDGLGTIGLGNLDTLGHGGGGGTGQGYGRGIGGGYGSSQGGLRSRKTGGPSVREIRTGVSLTGALSQEVIRRYIRRNINQIRYCYEQQLTRRPDLAGRVAIRFVISGSGAVSASSVANSTLGDPAAEQCVARAVQRIAFPQPDGGGVVIVTYPFMFQPAE